MTIDIDLDELEATAKAASQGLWEVDRNTPFSNEIIGIFQPDKLRYVVRAEEDEEISDADGAHIAAARPEVVLALIERVRTAEAASLVTPAQRDAVADHLWDQMVGVAKTSVREVMADAFLGAGIDVDRPDHPEKTCAACGHASDCSTHNEPALPAGPCDCSKVARS